MYGQPTITKGQEKSEEGNSPNHPGSSFYFTCLIRFSTRRCLYSQDHFCICRRGVSNGKIWMEFIVLGHHQIYILTSSLLGQTKTEKASEVILSFRIWRKLYCFPCTSRVEGIFEDKEVPFIHFTFKEVSDQGSQLSCTETRFQKCSQSGKNGSKHPMLYISMAHNVISCKKSKKTLKKSKSPILLCKFGSWDQKSPKMTKKNFALDLLIFFYRYGIL